MAPRSDRTTRIPSVAASSVATSHAAKGSVFVNLRNAGNLKNQPHTQAVDELKSMEQEIKIFEMIQHPNLVRYYGMEKTDLQVTSTQFCTRKSCEILKVDGSGTKTLISPSRFCSHDSAPQPRALLRHGKDRPPGYEPSILFLETLRNCKS